MILWTPTLIPLCFGLLIWLIGARFSFPGKPHRKLLGGSAALVLLAELICSLAAALSAGSSSFSWGGGLSLTLRVVPMVEIAVVLIPLIALPVVIWAAAVEADSGLARLLGLLVHVHRFNGITGACGRSAHSGCRLGAARAVFLGVDRPPLAGGRESFCGKLCL